MFSQMNRLTFVSSYKHYFWMLWCHRNGRNMYPIFSKCHLQLDIGPLHLKSGDTHVKVTSSLDRLIVGNFRSV